MQPFSQARHISDPHPEPGGPDEVPLHPALYKISLPPSTFPRPPGQQSAHRSGERAPGTGSCFTERIASRVPALPSRKGPTVANQHDNAEGNSFADDYFALMDELALDLEKAGQGYDKTRPLREAFGAHWDIRIQVAHLPAPRNSVVWVHEFFLVGLVRDGEAHFAKRCDWPGEVIEIFNDLNFGDLGEDVPVVDDAHMDVPYSARKYPVWQWMRAELPVPFLTPLYDEAFETRRQQEREYERQRSLRAHGRTNNRS